MSLIQKLKKILKQNKLIYFIYCNWFKEQIIENKTSIESKTSINKIYWYVLEKNVKIKQSHVKSKNITLLWVIPDVVKGSGGHLNIFRFIYLLAKNHQIYSDIVIFNNNPSDSDSSLTKKKINEFYLPFDGEVYFYNDHNHVLELHQQYDFIFATSWQTAYFVNNVKEIDRKMYFVQDYEPYFYSNGSDYYFSENTYKFGFTGITAGSWLSNKLQKKFNMQCFPFHFGYEDIQLSDQEKKNEVPRVLFYSRSATTRRCFELGILALTNLFEKTAGQIEFIFIGGDCTHYDIPFPYQDLGILEFSRLNKLYATCDVALVLSATSMSLLPLEILACNCEVVVNKGENNDWLDQGHFFHYVDPDVEAISDKIHNLILKKEIGKYQNFVNKKTELTTWDIEANKLADYLNKS